LFATCFDSNKKCWLSVLFEYLLTNNKQGGRDTIARRIAKGRHKVSIACEAVVMDWLKRGELWLEKKI
jgi:hypothetical protein